MIEDTIRKPVSVLVGAILVALFGALAYHRLPVQLTPDVDRPIITVMTMWEGASPQEVEREILDEQEDKLKGIQGLREMTSTARRGVAQVNLEFSVGVDISRALLDVSEKLRQVPEYPENVEEPVISSGEIEAENAIAWMVLERTPNSPIAEEDVPKLQTLMEEEVQPQLERAEGIASVQIFGGVEREVHVEVDLSRLALRALTLMDVRNAIRWRNLDISAGDLDEGKHSFSVRTVGEFVKLEEMEDLVLARRDGQTVYLRDVGEVSFGYKRPQAVVRSKGSPAIAMNASRQAGTNVIQVMDSLKEALERVNREILNPRGLRLTQVYDQTEYIFSAVDLVWQNLFVGGSLALAVLILFLRELRSTFIVGLAIPISVVGSFLGLVLMGRNLNVVSLAGLAFAVGMVVDNSIVVLENIFRHRQEGESPFTAALKGTREVWGAVAASTLTTLAVFVPVIFVEEEAGQLFRDIAIAISAAVLLSLLVSVLFVPTLVTLIFRERATGRRAGAAWRLFGLVSLAGGFASGVASTVAWLNRGVLRRLAAAALLTGLAIFLSFVLRPPTSYLPAGNQNLVIGFMITPPGYSDDEFIRIARVVESHIRPYWESGQKGTPLPPELARPAWYQGRKPIPAIGNFFFVSFAQGVFMGASSVDPNNVGPLARLMEFAGREIPGSMLFAFQRSLFERGISSGNSIDLEISASDYAEIQKTAGILTGAILQMEDPPLGYPRPEPSNYNLGAPELRVQVDQARASELGLSVRDLGFIVQCMVDGAVVSDYRDRGVTIDVKIMALKRDRPPGERPEQIPLYTPAGKQVPLVAVAAIQETTSPNEIRRLEKRRSVKLVVSPPQEPPPGVELSLAMEALEGLLKNLRQGGVIPPGVSTRLAGTADKLVTTREALQWNFLLAVVICYLLMSALFESFLYPLVILFSVPLAAVGGFLGLRIVHTLTGQQMDILTMLGFVILVGTVVNNAILIVHQALNNMRDRDLAPKEAVVLSVRTRVRPIFMSTMTSVFGMMPLVVFPGSGSELYRGLGSVVVGGLISSTIFTLFLIPILFSLAMEMKAKIAGLVRAG